MRRSFACLFSVGVLLGVADTADAAPPRKGLTQDCDSYCRRYPNATSRQLKNARAYDRGEYFEQDPNAHPTGSRGWWYLRERDGRRFGF